MSGTWRRMFSRIFVTRCLTCTPNPPPRPSWPPNLLLPPWEHDPNLLPPLSNLQQPPWLPLLPRPNLNLPANLPCLPVNLLLLPANLQLLPAILPPSSPILPAILPPMLSPPQPMVQEPCYIPPSLQEVNLRLLQPRPTPQWLPFPQLEVKPSHLLPVILLHPYTILLPGLILPLPQIIGEVILRWSIIPEVIRPLQTTEVILQEDLQMTDIGAEVVMDLQVDLHPIDREVHPMMATEDLHLRIETHLTVDLRGQEVVMVDTDYIMMNGCF